MSNHDFTIKRGNQYNYDRVGDEEREADGSYTKRGTHWSIIAARGVLADLTDRRGVKRELEDVDYDVREEIVETLAGIIALASDNREEYTSLNFNEIEY